MSRYVLLFGLSLTTLGCHRDKPLHPSPPDMTEAADMGGTGGGGKDDAGLPADAGGGGGGGTMDMGDGCPPASKVIYVIDDDGTLSSFKPDLTDITKSVFTDIGKLKCTASGSPFSMSVDREANAWVEYVDIANPSPNKIFKVSTTDASCTDTGFVGGQVLPQFGMGFVADAPLSKTEKLFLSGVDRSNSSTGLGTLDLKTLQIAKVSGPLKSGVPELAGTGLGDLWAFFPGSATHIAKLDQKTGAESDTIALIALESADNWAFAFYGGDFFVFMANGGQATTVYHVTSSGLKDMLDTQTRHIVGAGVSTCVPVVPPPPIP